MQTEMIILRVGKTPETRTVELPDEPGYRQLVAVVEPILGAPMEHVAVLYEGRRTDMFVDETGVVKGLPRNEEATRIYRSATLSRFPDTDPESLPFIAGTAVLFTRQVWF